MRTVIYWLTTGLVAAGIGSGGIAYLAHAEPVREGVTGLGYPAYLLTILGIWKILGTIAILVPRFPLVKEWAYAGLVFNLTGAAYSHVAAGDPLAKAVAPVVLLALTAASWHLRPPGRRLPNV